MPTQRLERLRRSLVGRGLDGLLVSSGANRRYLSGFTGSAGILLITAKEAQIATDFRYWEQVKAEAPHFVLVEVKQDSLAWLPKAISSLGIKALGFEGEHLHFAEYQRIKRELSPLQPRPRLISTRGVGEELRAMKEEEEVQRIARAVEMCDSAFEHLSGWLKPGVTELETAWEVERFLREAGSEPMPFPVIVASGPNAALPHAHPGERPIREGEPVIVDLGAVSGGYCSDMTRTFWLGEAPERLARVYDLVLGAQLTAIATLREGLNGEEGDSLARRVIEEGGYGEAFGHGLGHGLGLEVHEAPRLGKGSSQVLEEGMVFTVEPGIYIPGWGGVRIEDVVALDKAGVRVMGKAAKTGSVEG